MPVDSIMVDPIHDFPRTCGFRIPLAVRVLKVALVGNGDRGSKKTW
jgi:hypothetical protein